MMRSRSLPRLNRWKTPNSAIISLLSIDNACLYGQELRTVRELQESLAPKALTVPSGWQVAYRYLPAGRSTHVGGD